MAKGILLVGFDYTNAHTDEFHDWYDLEHLPEREAVPGFGSCKRWMVPGSTQAVATYDLDTLSVLDSDAYGAIAYANLSPWSKRVTGMCQRLVRIEGDIIGDADASTPEHAGAVLVNAMNVDPAHEEEFNAWYDEEHLPALLGVPGSLNAWRYRGRDGSTHKYLAIYFLENTGVAESDAWRTAARTPWSAKVTPHFRDRVRLLCTAYTRT
jgi:hypothetical protein